MSVASAEMKSMSGPFLKSRLTSDTLMLHTLYALLPLVALGYVLFGLSALLVTATTVAACVLTEYAVCRAWNRPVTLGDYSAVTTGVLLALTLPPALPLWMAFLGGVIAIALGKMLFGGFCASLFNPVLVGRLFLQAVFPTAMATLVPTGVPNRLTALIPSTLALPFTATPSVSAYANTLAAGGWDPSAPKGLLAHLIGTVPGGIGETSALLILACGAFLAARSFLKWRVTVAALVAALITASAFAVLQPGMHANPLATLLSGGLVLGAVFIATDPVTSPATRRGMYVYGALIGIVAVVLTKATPLSHGIVFAILLGNLLVPFIERITQPRPYGYQKPPKKL
ncbi:MAG: RnfABCDGE type electron transport complex subunit D [FCB group bacterium]|jgi:electron transport complex protein RnfD|nr:RnfABCDGE type electron transport complex subunit D [FCB group bacterium]